MEAGFKRFSSDTEDAKLSHLEVVTTGVHATGGVSELSSSGGSGNSMHHHLSTQGGHLRHTQILRET